MSKVSPMDDSWIALYCVSFLFVRVHIVSCLKGLLLLAE